MEKTASARTDRLSFDNGTLLCLKLLAFALMIADHVDWLIFDGQGVHAGIGRLVFPIFGMVLAYNMARTPPEKLLTVVAPRLLTFGMLAQLPYAYLQGGWIPGNILLTLSLVVFVYGLVTLGQLAAAFALALVAGTFVDYAWFGVVPVVLLAITLRDGHEGRVMLALFGFAFALTPVNRNVWALLAVPLLWAASQMRLGDAPRLRWLFWLGYPVHLVVLAVFKAL